MAQPVDELQAFLEANENALRLQMNLTNDWCMRDLPWMKAEYFQQLVDIIGTENMQIVSGTKKEAGAVDGEGRKMVRATIFVNKQGRENIIKFAQRVHT